MIKFLMTACLLLLCAGPAAHAQLAATAPPMSAEARDYLEAALDSLQQLSLRRAETDWRAVRDSALLLAAGAQRPAHTYGAIQWALSRVDVHSFLQAPFPWVNAELIRSGVGYVRIPFHPAGARQQLADTLQAALRELEAAGACAWVVDLRMNGGGNVWPMYAGIGPLLGDTVLNATRAGDELVPGALYSEGAAVGISDTGERVTVASAAEPYAMRRSGAPVAVLIDGGTGSSGEAIAIAFRTRPQTRFFGAPTAGLTTANRGVLLPDGANMVVTVEAMTDRFGRHYTAALEPDEHVPMPPGFWPSPADAVSRAAVRWLTSQDPCTETD